jgi:hypothetical protein
LCGDSAERKHSKTSVQHFSGLHTVGLFLVLALEELKGVKAEVSGLTVKLSLGDLDEGSTAAELDEGDRNEQELHGSLPNKDVVGIVGVGDAVNRIDASGETHHDSEGTIGGEPSEPGKHGNTSVFELGLTHPVEGGDSLGFFPRRRLDDSSEVLGDGGQVEGVEANITGHRSIKVNGARQPWKRSGSLGRINHLVPHAVRHTGLQGSCAFTSGSRGESHGRSGHHGENSGSEGVHGQLLSSNKRWYHWGNAKQKHVNTPRFSS